MSAAQRIVRDATFLAIVLLTFAVLLIAPAFAGPAVCEREVCRIHDRATGLSSIPVLRGWRLEEAYFYETAGGAKAKRPTIVLARGDAFVVLNGRQITGAACERSGEDAICITRPVTDAADAQARALARWLGGSRESLSRGPC